MKNHDLLTVGEIAKEMNVTVRTLQYYDKEGLLKPSVKSEGGRRLYTRKDLIKLYQIVSFKYLGFSLGEIKDRLFTSGKPEEIAYVLDEQSKIIAKQLDALKHAFDNINVLKNEVMQIDTVDFSKYADIISLLREKNENYWVIKNFDEKLNTYIRDRFKDKPDEGIRIMNNYLKMLDKVVLLKKSNEPTDSEQSILIAKEWWDMVNEFTGGDINLLPEIMKFNDKKGGWNEEIAEKQEFIDDFIAQALMAYFKKEKIYMSELNFQ